MPPVDARRRLRRKTADAMHASSSGEAGRAADRLETCTSACGEAARASASGEARQTAERVTTCASASGEAVRASGDAAPPSASCEAVRASSVSEASRASASGEAGRAADLIQKRPAAKDRKGRVRVQVHGVRKWVRKEDAVACEASLQQVYRRLQKKTRGPRAAGRGSLAEGGCGRDCNQLGRLQVGRWSTFSGTASGAGAGTARRSGRGWKCRGARARCAGGPGLRRPKWW